MHKNGQQKHTQYEQNEVSYFSILSPNFNNSNAFVMTKILTGFFWKFSCSMKDSQHAIGYFQQQVMYRVMQVLSDEIRCPVLLTLYRNGLIIDIHIFQFSCTFIEFRADQILVYIAQEVPMLFEIFDFFNTVVQDKIACNCT